jgi:hypothetical protein
MNNTKQPATNRRSFIKTAALGAGASLVPAGILSADEGGNHRQDHGLSDGDAAVLRFLAAAETLETDAWEQYAEFADQTSPYAAALEAIDGDMPAYLDQQLADSASHAAFLNAFLVKMGRAPVDLSAFRTLPSSPVAPVQKPRLTSLMHLNVDTSWYRKYRSDQNPDFGATFSQVVNIMNRPGIPVQKQTNYTANQMQAIANTGAFHFAMLEQGGASLYDALTANVSGAVTLRILTSIEGTEVAHFAIWHDKAGDAPPVDSGDGLVFPDLNADPATATNKVMPRPCEFISADLPLCSIIRPTSIPLAGATAVAHFLTNTSLFAGQSQAFFNAVLALASAADRARGGEER